MLKDILNSKKCFKLVCGAGNEDASEVEKLVTIYSKAGCNFFDVCAKSEIVDAAKRGLKRAEIDKDRYLCVSVGIKGDPHITKASINKKKCIKCGNCSAVCINNAIEWSNNQYQVKQIRCIGCSQCLDVCPQKAINVESKLIDYKEVLPEIIDKGIDCIEFHAISNDINEIENKWNQINSIYNGMLCISLNRSKMGDTELVGLVQKLLKNRAPYSTIIQADGIAMSGTNNEYSTTLQAVATAQMFQKSKLPAYIMMSGGTNSNSIKLASLCNVSLNALAVGSYARKIVKDYVNSNDLFDNPDKMSQAVEIAKTLVDTVYIR